MTASATTTRRRRPGVDSDHEHYKWWALSCTSLGMLLATINSGTLIIALPDLERALGHQHPRARVGDPRLHDRLDGAGPHRGPAVRPVRAQAGLRRRLRGLRARVAGRRLLARRDDPDRLARSCRGSAARSCSRTPPRWSRTRSRASSSASRWGRTRWSRRSGSCSGRCSAARSSRSPGTGCSGSTSRSPRSARSGPRSCCASSSSPERTPGYDLAGHRGVRRRAHGPRARRLARRHLGLERPADARLADRRRGPAPAVRADRAPCPGPDARPDDLPQPDVLRRDRGRVHQRALALRADVPVRLLLPGREGRRPDQGRDQARAARDRHADRLAAGRRLGRPPRVAGAGRARDGGERDRRSPG